MQLAKVKISNFRSFRKEQVIEIDKLSVLIGSNSSGKTTFLNALLRMFGDLSSDREIKRSDFHIPCNIEPDSIDENEFSIEVIFEFPEAIEKSAIAKISIPPFFESFIINEKNKPPYIRIRLEATWQRSNQPEGIIESSIFFVVSPESKKFEDKDKKRIDKSQLSLIKVIYIPAQRNPSAQLKMASGTMIWRLINGVNFNSEFKGSVKEKIAEVNNIIDEHRGITELKRIMEGEWKRYHKDNRYENLELNFNTNDIESILSKIEPSFTPTETGNDYRIDDLGDGLRSMFYFSLVSSLLKAEESTLKEKIEHPEVVDDDRTFSFSPPVITIMAVEEPENHIAPHLLGKVMLNLKDLSCSSNAQVIISSHSPAIIKRIEPTDIRHFRNCKEELCTIVNKILLPDEVSESYKYVKEAVKAYPELYFSSLIILGEGDSEEIVLPKVLEVIDVEANANEIAIVPLGGRHVNHFWKLLNQLHIPFITLLDLDLERFGGGWGRIKYVLKQLMEIGYSKEDILELEDGSILSDKELEDMHNWNDSTKEGRENLFAWISFLEKYNVFFSSPLDIDFLMLKYFKNEYISIIEKNEGPEIKIDKNMKKINLLTKDELESKAYKERKAHDVGRTLKDNEKKGEWYTEEEKDLMVWYNYFFLNRGKPSTHIAAINTMQDKVLLANLPELFVRLTDAIKESL